MNRSVCTICADYLTCENSVACPCGHTFHYECITRWKEQSSTCPQCRVRFKSTIKLYFELSREDKVEGDPAELRNEVTELKLRIRVRDSSIETLQKEKNTFAKDQKAKDEEIKTTQRLLDNALGSSEALRKQITYLEKFKNEAKRARDELQLLQKKVGSYHNIQELVEGESFDIERTLQNFGDNPDAFNQICTSYVVLKKEFERLKDSKRTLENEKKSLRKKVDIHARESFESKEKLTVVTNDLKNLDERNRSLTKKLALMEKTLENTTPRSSAIKRLICESPAPVDLKRQCVFDSSRELDEWVADESLPLFSDQPQNDSGYEGKTDNSLHANPVQRKPLSDFTGRVNNGILISRNSNKNAFDKVSESSGTSVKSKKSFNVVDIQDEGSDSYTDLDLDEEESLKIADEFGLELVATTSVAQEMKASIDSTRKNKSSFVSKKHVGRSNNAKSSVVSEESDLPHFRRGFNGMGGHTKTLVIPKKVGALVKQPANKKGFKIPRNNAKITKFISDPNPKLPSIELSP